MKPASRPRLGGAPAGGQAAVRRAAAVFPQIPLPPLLAWARVLDDLRQSLDRPKPRGTEAWPLERQVFYVLDAPRTTFCGEAIVQLYFRDRDKKGNWRRRKSRELALGDLGE